MATFWERATGFGDGASDTLDLERLEHGFFLWLTERVTASDAADWIGLTSAQQAELQTYVFTRYSGITTAQEAVPFARDLRLVLEGARAGRSALDSIQNVWTALHYIPPE